MSAPVAEPGGGAGARAARADDVPILAELVAIAVDEQREGRGGAVWSVREARARPADASLQAALGEPDHLVLAGTYDGSVVGYAVAHHEELRDGGRLGVIADVFVLPGARDVGVGEALVEGVLGWCRATGCRGIDALALPGNRATKNFFETFGFTARAIIVHRDLTGEAGP